MFIIIGLFLMIVMPIILGGTMILAVASHHNNEKRKINMKLKEGEIK